ncbi:MAG TPA: hypothetical protein VLB74_05230, partial [Flavobacterium sp.]|nr:hypothetical protein [Flavobacterium sp.]
QETRDKRQETRDKRQETGGKRQETRDKRQETKEKRKGKWEMGDLIFLTLLIHRILLKQINLSIKKGSLFRQPDF